MLLYVAENPGITISELAEVSGCSLATASRTARALAPAGMSGSLPPYLGLVVVQKPRAAPQHKPLYLTSEGVALCLDLDRIIRQARPVAAVGRQERDTESRAAPPS